MTPTRPEFFHVSPTGQLLFYALAFLSIGVMAFFIGRRWREWRRGRPISWSVKPNGERIRAIWTEILWQRKVRQSRKSYGAPMHLMLFFGFLILFIGTTLLAINHWSPVKFHYGTYFLAYEFTLDVFGAFFLVGLLMAIGRRYLRRPTSVGNESGDAYLLFLLLIITVTGFLLEGARIALQPHEWDLFSPVGKGVAVMLGGMTVPGYQTIWWTHAGLIFLFLATIPLTHLRHIIYAMFSTYSVPPRPVGALAPISLEEVERTGKIGATEATDYNAWQLASADACMECGRCTDVCPAHGAGKSLDPKRIVQDLRIALRDGKPVAEAMTEEALWACTTCNACVRECPVNIRHVDLIVDARRALVAEGRLTGSGANVLRQIASTGSAWGTTDREAWMEGLDVPLVRNGAEFDVLLWVGCAGAVDKGAQKTNRALVQLMRQAGVRFACLGNDETCTGDPARRIGDEFLFQQMAEKNIGTMNQRAVKTVVTACPHCFNTMKNEYPQFDGLYDVMHHTQFLAKLISEGKLTKLPPSFEERERGRGGVGVSSDVVFHDPCYLARVNKEVDAPRKLHDMLQPAESGERTLCCGAGGGRMWMEEPPNQRPGIRRAEQLLATGAKTIAVACPFCRIMISDSVKAARPDEEINIVDIAELLLNDQT